LSQRLKYGRHRCFFYRRTEFGKFYDTESLHWPGITRDSCGALDNDKGTPFNPFKGEAQAALFNP